MNRNIQETVPDIAFDLKDGKMIELVSYDPADQKFQLEKEATDIIENYDGYVGFVVFCGEKGVGKSSLLDWTAGIENTRKETQGIRMWTKPIYNDLGYLNIYLLDCQGFGKMGEAADNRIFSFLFLISSIMVYNSKGLIKDENVFGMRMINSLSEIFQVAYNKDQSDFAMAYYAPKLYWALRDVDTDFVDEKGNEIDSKKYLDGVLTDIIHQKMNPQTIKIRQNILNIVKRRECLAFPTPKKSGVSQQHDFMGQIYRLRERIYSKTVPKQMDGINMTPRMMTNFMEIIIENLNETESFNLLEAWSQVMYNECRISFFEATDTHHSFLKEKLDSQEEPYGEEDLQKLIKLIRTNTINVYSQVSHIGEHSDHCRFYEEYFLKLQIYIGEKENLIRKINNKLGKDRNQKELVRLSKDIASKIEAGYYNINNIPDLQKKVNYYFEEYGKRAMGDEATPQLVKHFSTLNNNILHQLASNSQDFDLGEDKDEDNIDFAQLEIQYKQKIEDKKKYLENRKYKTDQDDDKIKKLKESNQTLNEKIKKLETQKKKLDDEKEEKAGKIEEQEKFIEKLEKDLEIMKNKSKGLCG